MGDLIFGLKLTLIGMGTVFTLLIALGISIWIVAKIWGPKQMAPANAEKKGE